MSNLFCSLSLLDRHATLHNCFVVSLVIRMQYNYSFEDLVRILEENKSLFKTLFLLTATYVSPLSITYIDFLVLFCPF
jgi:hypothetical protein